MSEEYSYLPPEQVFLNEDTGLFETIAPALLFPGFSEIIDLVAIAGKWDQQIEALKNNGYLTGTLQTPE